MDPNRPRLTLRAAGKAMMFDAVLNNASLQEAARMLAPGQTVRLAGVWGSSSALMAEAIGRLTDAPVLFIARHLDAADELADDVEVLTGQPAELFPAWETDLSVDHISDEVSGQRVSICNELARGPAPRVIVAPIMALLQAVPDTETLATGRLELRTGSDCGVEKLAGWLVDAGYEPVDQVDQQGEFAHRGGIVDVFPPAASQAVRLEFFGDTVDSIRHFDLDSTRSTDVIDAVDLTSLSVGREAATASLLDYLPPETIICVPEPAEIIDLAAEIYERTVERMQHSSNPIAMIEPETLFHQTEQFARVMMHGFRPKQTEATFHLGIRSLERLSTNTADAFGELDQLTADADVWVFCENPSEQKRFSDLLSQYEVAGWKKIRTAIGHVHTGFHWPDEKLVVIGHHEVFHRYQHRRRIRRVRAGRPIESLTDLSQGDFVVHVAHGVARFGGLRILEQHDRKEEFLALRFADNAVLHVPASQIHLVQKYVGAGRKRPTLSKLGGRSWQKQKDRVAEAVKDMAAEMIRTQAMRQAVQGTSYPIDTEMQRQLTWPQASRWID